MYTCPSHISAVVSIPSYQVVGERLLAKLDDIVQPFFWGAIKANQVFNHIMIVQLRELQESAYVSDP